MLFFRTEKLARPELLDKRAPMDGSQAPFRPLGGILRDQQQIPEDPFLLQGLEPPKVSRRDPPRRIHFDTVVSPTTKSTSCWWAERQNARGRLSRV
jgi:hypothetical protein